MRLINKIIKSGSSGLKIRLIWVCEMGGCARWGGVRDGGVCEMGVHGLIVSFHVVE